MMQKTIYLVFTLLLFFAFNAKSQKQASQDPKYIQMMRDPGSTSFYDIQSEANNYFLGKYKGRGSGYKQFKRWEHMTERRLSSSGKMINIAARTVQEYEKYITNFNPQSLPVHYDPGYWESMGPDDHTLGDGWNGGIGRVNCIAFNPINSGYYYVGTPSGGLWMNTPANGWEPLTDGIPAIGVSGIAIHPTDPYNTIYILTGDGDGRDTYSIGVLKTTNGGITWQPTSLSWDVDDLRRGYKLIMHPTNPDVQLVAADNGIYKTTDGWNTHTRVEEGWFYDIAFKPGIPLIVYATSDSCFWRSQNGGDIWNNPATGLPFGTDKYRIAIGVSPADNDYVYLLFGRPTNNETRSAFQGFYKSTNDGNSFTPQSNIPNILGYSQYGSDDKGQYWYDLAIAVHPTNISEIHIGGINCWKSDNKGEDWSITSFWKENNVFYEYTHADIHALEYSPIMTNSLFCGSDGGIYKTINSGTDWTDESDGLVITQFYRIGTTPQDIDKISGGTQDNGGNTLNGSLFKHDVGGDGFSAMIDYTNTDIIYQSNQSEIYRSSNNGASFWKITPGIVNEDIWDVGLTMHPTSPTTLFMGHDDIWKTTNSGSLWSSMGTGNSGGKKFIEIAHGINDLNRIYGITEDSIYMTNNGGTSWSNIDSTLPVKQDFTYIAASPINATIVYVSCAGYNDSIKIYKSTDAGTSWINWSGSLPNIPVNCIICDNTSNNGVYAGTDVGVFYRDLSMTDWVPFFNGLPNVIVNEMEINTTSNKLIAGTFGRGIWQTSLFGNCNSAYVLNNSNNPSTSSTQYYAASNYITSTRTVNRSYDNTSVTYKADNYVELLTGFNTKDSTKFQAINGPCTGTVVKATNYDIRKRVSGYLSNCTQTFK